MNVLFIHQNFPGQFIHLSAHLAAQKRNRVVALTMRDNPAPTGVMVRGYSLLRAPVPETHPMLKDEEAKVLRAEACAAAAFQLKREGFEPDVIYAHPGWGEALFIKDVFPKAKIVIYCEYYYAAEGQDVGFDPSDPPLTFQQRCRIRMKNSTNLLSMEVADAAISPTAWQKSTYPDWAQDKISVIHDGIDYARLMYNPKAQINIVSGANGGELTLKAGDEVLSYVARNLEPVRGFHMLMRTLPDVLKARPGAQVVIVGGDEVSYGRPAPQGLTWRDHLLNEVGADIDLSRVHFVGKIPYQSYVNLLNVSRVHAYWTTPFVLSWSFLEAAVNGLPIVTSATPPTMEFAPKFDVELVDFFDSQSFAGALARKLEKPTRRAMWQRPAELNITECVRRQADFLNTL